VSVIDAAMITDLRALARQARELAYTGGYDKEHALLGLANALSKAVSRLDGGPEHG
jgi:hypothetical protein